MNRLPIRLRLTLWYCLIFGILIVSVVSTVYFAHQAAHYNEIDRTLNSVSFHVLEELHRDLENGKTLSQARLIFKEMPMEDIYTVIRDESGKKVAANTSVDFTPEFSIVDMEETLYTWKTPEGRFRIIVRPIYHDNKVVGYIQSGFSLNQIDQSLLRFKWMIIGITGLVFILALMGGWYLAKKVLNRVERISQTARSIAASQGFHQRVLHIGPKDELGELAETFNEMLASLEKAYMSQKRFIADASHELRAPLTTIRGNIDILLKMRNSLAEEQVEILQDLRSEAIRMSKMVSDLLSLARADAGQDIRMQAVDLAKIVRDVHLEAQSWGSNVQIEYHTEDAVFTWGNQDLLKQLVLILVENAIRYTPEGGKVFFSACETTTHSVITVKDSGIGIKSEELLHIFDRFYRSEAARIKSPEGTGLGLAIAKWIVEQHHGSISATSKPGNGSEFTVKLPMINSKQHHGVMNK